LPAEVYWRFEVRQGNKQSQLLQEVKGTLLNTFPQTDMRGDGQVVVVPFALPIEVVPAFLGQDSKPVICDTTDGGRYRTSTSLAEIDDIRLHDAATNGNLRDLIRMLKKWQRENDVPLKSFLLERVAVQFLSAWAYRGSSTFWYDWMIRDFFQFLLGRLNTYVVMPGTLEVLPLGNAWYSKAQTAYGHAVKACDYERANEQFLAGLEWQSIFGLDINVWVA
jgi:hypothetical protein